MFVLSLTLNIHILYICEVFYFLIQLIAKPPLHFIVWPSVGSKIQLAAEKLDGELLFVINKFRYIYGVEQEIIKAQ